MGKNYSVYTCKLIRLFFPVILFFSRIFKRDTESIRRLYIDINNTIVQSANQKYLPSEVLILLPHCLQNYDCPHKITSQINNCKRCGKCCISDIIDLSTNMGVQVKIVTGGTAARGVIRDIRPKVILAVACERDLMSGILDIKKIPVIGILNDRPYGPCKNTKIDVNVLRAKLESIL